jgi:hypothetical protein
MVVFYYDEDGVTDKELAEIDELGDYLSLSTAQWSILGFMKWLRG